MCRPAFWFCASALRSSSSLVCWYCDEVSDNWGCWRWQFCSSSDNYCATTYVGAGIGNRGTHFGSALRCQNGSFGTLRPRLLFLAVGALITGSKACRSFREVWADADGLLQQRPIPVGAVLAGPLHKYRNGVRD
uniref:Snake toxin/toxin-like domain-containing protein n=1 Tax=Salvator merianae TaxID=96440 RepID=A0A8D0BLR1_SALMN